MIRSYPTNFVCLASAFRMLLFAFSFAYIEAELLAWLHHAACAGCALLWLVGFLSAFVVPPSVSAQAVY
jgi:hypothetical protein